MSESSSESDATDDDSNTFFTFGKKGKIFRVANATDCAIYIGEQADRVLGGGGASLGVDVLGYGGNVKLEEKHHKPVEGITWRKVPAHRYQYKQIKKIYVYKNIDSEQNM